MVKKLFQFYLDNQNQLIQEFKGKYLVITDKGVVASFDSESEAYYSAKSSYGLGNFIVQLCMPGDEAYSQHFYSPVISF